WTLGPQPPDERRTVDVRHPQIGKDCIEVAFGSCLKRDFSVRTHRDAEPLLRQKVVDGGCEQNIVLGNEDPPPTRAFRHRLILAPAPAAETAAKVHHSYERRRTTRSQLTVVCQGRRAAAATMASTPMIQGRVIRDDVHTAAVHPRSSPKEPQPLAFRFSLLLIASLRGPPPRRGCRKPTRPFSIVRMNPVARR